VRIKALPLSQSKQKKRTKGVITIQRQRFLEPETTNIRVIDPTTHPCPPHACPPPCALPPPHAPLCSALPPPTPPLQRTHRHHHRRQHQAPSPYRTRCRVAPTPSPLLRNRTPTLAYKPPHQLPQLPTRSKHTPDKSPLPNRKQLHFPLPRP